MRAINFSLSFSSTVFPASFLKASCSRFSIMSATVSLSRSFFWRWISVILAVCMPPAVCMTSNGLPALTADNWRTSPVNWTLAPTRSASASRRLMSRCPSKLASSTVQISPLGLAASCGFAPWKSDFTLEATSAALKRTWSVVLARSHFTMPRAVARAWARTSLAKAFFGLISRSLSTASRASALVTVPRATNNWRSLNIPPGISR